MSQDAAFVSAGLLTFLVQDTYLLKKLFTTKIVHLKKIYMEIFIAFILLGYIACG